jgi:hypothetical protein
MLCFPELRSGSTRILSNLNTQLPYAYVSLVSLVVHCYLIVLATWLGILFMSGYPDEKPPAKLEHILATFMNQTTNGMHISYFPPSLRKRPQRAVYGAHHPARQLGETGPPLPCLLYVPYSYGFGSPENTLPNPKIS